MPDLDDPAATIDLCRGAHERLARSIDGISDLDVRRPSQLAGWTVGHVLTHMARNADGHVRRLAGSLAGDDTPRYPGGSEQREREINEGASRGAAEIVDDVTTSSARLEACWDECVAAGWPHPDLRGGDVWPTTSSPVRRLREVEFHHVDLGLGYDASSWDDDYVRWELGQVLAGVPDRLASPHQAREMILWLTRGGPTPVRLDLEPW